jgi:hypothetical protein
VEALCLSWWHDEWSGCREANRSHPHEDKHKAPSSTPLRPLSLQEAGRTFPDSVGNIHQGWTLLAVRNCHVPLNLALERRPVAQGEKG